MGIFRALLAVLASGGVVNAKYPWVQWYLQDGAAAPPPDRCPSLFDPAAGFGPLMSATSDAGTAYVLGAFSQSDYRPGASLNVSDSELDLLPYLWFSRDGGASWDCAPLPDRVLRPHGTLLAFNPYQTMDGYKGEVVCIFGGLTRPAGSTTSPWSLSDAVTCTEDDGQTWVDQRRLPRAMAYGAATASYGMVFVHAGEHARKTTGMCTPWTPPAPESAPWAGVTPPAPKNTTTAGTGGTNSSTTGGGNSTGTSGAPATPTPTYTPLPGGPIYRAFWLPGAGAGKFGAFTSFQTVAASTPLGMRRRIGLEYLRSTGQLLAMAGHRSMEEDPGMSPLDVQTFGDSWMVDLPAMGNCTGWRMVGTLPSYRGFEKLSTTRPPLRSAVWEAVHVPALGFLLLPPGFMSNRAANVTVPLPSTGAGAAAGIPDVGKRGVYDLDDFKAVVNATAPALMPGLPAVDVDGLSFETVIIHSDGVYTCVSRKGGSDWLCLANEKWPLSKEQEFQAMDMPHSALGLVRAPAELLQRAGLSHPAYPAVLAVTGAVPMQPGSRDWSGGGSLTPAGAPAGAPPTPLDPPASVPSIPLIPGTYTGRTGRGRGLHGDEHGPSYAGALLLGYHEVSCAFECAQAGDGRDSWLDVASAGCKAHPWDAVCTPCTQCEAGITFQRLECGRVGLGGTLADTVCSPCSGCEYGYAPLSSCSGRNDTVCGPILLPKQFPVALPTTSYAMVEGFGSMLGACLLVLMCAGRFGYKRHVSRLTRRAAVGALSVGGWASGFIIAGLLISTAAALKHAAQDALAPVPMAVTYLQVCGVLLQVIMACSVAINAAWSWALAYSLGAQDASAAAAGATAAGISTAKAGPQREWGAVGQEVGKAAGGGGTSRNVCCRPWQCPSAAGWSIVLAASIHPRLLLLREAVHVKGYGTAGLTVFSVPWAIFARASALSLAVGLGVELPAVLVALVGATLVENNLGSAVAGGSMSPAIKAPLVPSLSHNDYLVAAAAFILLTASAGASIWIALATRGSRSFKVSRAAVLRGHGLGDGGSGAGYDQPEGHMAYGGDRGKMHSLKQARPGSAAHHAHMIVMSPLVAAEALRSVSAQVGAAAAAASDGNASSRPAAQPPQGSRIAAALAHLQATQGSGASDRTALLPVPVGAAVAAAAAASAHGRDRRADPEPVDPPAQVAHLTEASRGAPLASRTQPMAYLPPPAMPARHGLRAPGTVGGGAGGAVSGAPVAPPAYEAESSDWTRYDRVRRVQRIGSGSSGGCAGGGGGDGCAAGEHERCSGGDHHDEGHHAHYYSTGEQYPHYHQQPYEGEAGQDEHAQYDQQEEEEQEQEEARTEDGPCSAGSSVYAGQRPRPGQRHSRGGTGNAGGGAASGSARPTAAHAAAAVVPAAPSAAELYARLCAAIEADPSLLEDPAACATLHQLQLLMASERVAQEAHGDQSGCVASPGAADGSLASEDGHSDYAGGQGRGRGVRAGHDGAAAAGGGAPYYGYGYGVIGSWFGQGGMGMGMQVAQEGEQGDEDEEDGDEEEQDDEEESEDAFSDGQWRGAGRRAVAL